MKFIKKGCFLIIFIILISIFISSLKESFLAIRIYIDEETTKVEQKEKFTKVEETKNYELDFQSSMEVAKQSLIKRVEKMKTGHFYLALTMLLQLLDNLSKMYYN